MIKPSIGSSTTGVAGPPSAPREAESRSGSRGGDAPSFAGVLGAQGGRPDDVSGGAAAVSPQGAAEREAGDDLADHPAAEQAVSPLLEGRVAPIQGPAMPDALPVTGALQGASTAQLEPGGEADLAALPGASRAASPTEAIDAALRAMADHQAFEARTLADGESQKRLALAGAVATTPVGAGTTSGAALGGTRGEDAAPEVDGPSPGPLHGDTRTALRGPDAPHAAARPPELRAPPGSAAWAHELGARVTWMLDRGEQVASLRLSPEDLGPLEVRIAVREGETTVWFGAANAETRAALEQSLPRLREMLGASGLALANAGVFSDTPRDPQGGFTAASLARASRESGADAMDGIVTHVTRRGLVDLYA